MFHDKAQPKWFLWFFQRLSGGEGGMKKPWPFTGGGEEVKRWNRQCRNVDAEPFSLQHLALWKAPHRHAAGEHPCPLLRFGLYEVSADEHTDWDGLQSAVFKLHLHHILKYVFADWCTVRIHSQTEVRFTLITCLRNIFPIPRERRPYRSSFPQ